MDGNRVAKEESGGKSWLPWTIAGCVAALLAVGYLALCVWAKGRDTILPNVSVAGIDVSNMTVTQAENAIRTAVDQRGRDIKLTLVYEDLEESMDASQLAYPVGDAARAFSIGHEQFLDSGWRLVGHLLGMSARVPLALTEDDPALTDLMERMERTVSEAAEDQGYQVEGDRLVMTKGAPTATVDWDAVRDEASKALQEAFEEDGPVEKRVVLTTQSETEEPDFEAIHRELYAEAKDATLDLESMEITDHVVGVDFEVPALRAAWQSAKGGETFSIPLTVTQPKVTKEDLGGRLFSDLLGEGTTQVSGSANRKHNVKLAAAACDGVILLPGEEFSYNNTTGSRTEAKGYKEAPIYAGSKSDMGVGGGVCQPSSTIYFAVLHTNLEIVERHAHGFNTGYVDPGMDATVFFGVQDFRFKNSTDYPVKIVTSSYDSKGSRYLNVKIYGTNPEGIYAVPKSDVYNWVSPTTVYQPDPEVPQGTLVLDREQYAYTGVSARTYRNVYDKDGNLLEKQDMGNSKYNMRPNTYHYNPADGDPSTWVDGKPPVPGTTDPGTTDPGTTDPGTTDPGTTDPGTTDPGTTDPGTGDPGVTDPGTTDPGTTDPGVAGPDVTDPGTTDPGTAGPGSDSGLTVTDPNVAAA